MRLKTHVYGTFLSFYPYFTFAIFLVAYTLVSKMESLVLQATSGSSVHIHICTIMHLYVFTLKFTMIISNILALL